MKNPIWVKEFDPYRVLSISTFITMIIFFVFLVKVLIDGGRSISDEMDIDKRSMVTYTFILYAHSYAITAYLVIMSKVFKRNTFILIVALCISYIVSLMVLSYLPVSSHNQEHRIITITAFILAGGTLIVHDLNISHFVQKIPNYDLYIVTIELFLFVSFWVSGFVFWFYDLYIFENICVFIVIIDKLVKVKLLIIRNVINVKGAMVTYAYHVAEVEDDELNRY